MLVSEDRLALDFVLHGGGQTGLGHVMRCAALANTAVARGHSVRCLLNDDEAARSVWEQNVPGVQAEPWSAWNNTSVTRCAMIDLPGAFRLETENWISRYVSRGVRIVLIDQPQRSTAVDLFVEPGLHHSLMHTQKDSHDSTPESAPFHPRQILSGPRYAILSDAHLETRSVAYQPRDRLLLSMGGADPRQLTPRVARIIDGILSHGRGRTLDLKRRAVIGPAFDESAFETQELLERGGWILHRALKPSAMADLMERSRVAIVGFGTSLTELAWHQTPFASITHGLADDRPAAQLEASGVGIHLGCAENFDSEQVTFKLSRALFDTEWADSSRARAHTSLEDGQGRERILDAIESLAVASPHPSSRSQSQSVGSTRNQAPSDGPAVIR